jgi:outer membrane protein TolC
LNHIHQWNFIPTFWRLLGLSLALTVLTAGGRGADQPTPGGNSILPRTFLPTEESSGSVDKTTEGRSETDPIELLLQKNRSIQAAQQSYEAAQERIRTKGVLPDPVLSNTTFLAPIETKNGPMENQLMLGQKFPLWGKLSRERNIAEYAAQKAGYSLEQQKIMAVYQMNRQYATFLKLVNSLSILEKYREELESFRRVALTQYATGTGVTQHPILKLQIEKSLVESQMNTLQSKLETVINELQTLFDGAYTPALFPEDWDIQVPSRPAEEWLQLAEQVNPSFGKVKASLEIARLQNELATRKNYPDLVAGVTYTSIGPSSPGSGADALGVKLGLNLPLWLRRNKARVAATHLEVRAQEELVEETWNQIEGDIRSVKKRLDEIEETYRLYQGGLVGESEQMLASAYSAYETGKIGFLDLLDSERMVVRIRLDFEAVKADRRVAAAELLKAVGMIRLNEE